MNIILTNRFTELNRDEILMVDAGGTVAKALYITGGIVASVWTPIVTGALAVTGVGAPAAVGAALIGSGAATYCFSMASHS